MWLIILKALLTFLPLILDLLTKDVAKNRKWKGRQLDELNEVTWYADQIAAAAPKVGAAKGGVPPERAKAWPARKKGKV